MTHITMVGKLSECYLLAYRARVEDVRRVLPPPLEPLTVDGSGFWNVVLSKVEKMRPKHMPRFLGSSYVHVAYRVYVRARTEAGEPLEGLHFLRSDADDHLIARVGDLMTDFKFHASKVEWAKSEQELAVDVATKDGEGDARVRISLRPHDAPVAGFLKYQPLGISTNARGSLLRLAEVLRDEAKWSERAVRVNEAEFVFLERAKQRDLTLVAATEVAPLDYTWRIGRTAKVGLGTGSGWTPRPDGISI